MSDRHGHGAGGGLARLVAGRPTARHRLAGCLGTGRLSDARRRGGLSTGGALGGPAVGLPGGSGCLAAVAIQPRGAVLAGCLAGCLILLEPAAVWAAPICAAIFWWGAKPCPASQRMRGPALGRLLIPAGAAATILAGWYGGSWLLGRATSPPPAGQGQFCLQRLRDFLLANPAGLAAQAGPLARFATIACLVLALMGCCTAWQRWRTLWPTAAIFAAVTLAEMAGWTAAGSRLWIEPLARSLGGPGGSPAVGAAVGRPGSPRLSAGRARRGPLGPRTRAAGPAL